MRVLVLAPPMAEAGGIQRYTAMLLRALKDLLAEDNVRCLSLTDAMPAGSQRRLSAGSKLVFAFRALLQAVGWRPNLIICAHLGLGPVARLISKIGRRRYWVFVYGIEAWAPLSRGKRLALNTAARVIGISAFTCEQVKSIQRVKAARLALLPCALDEGLSSIQPAGEGPHQLVGEGSSVVLTVARMAASERYKGHDVVLRALKTVLPRVPKLVYFVVGEGDDRARIEALANSLGVGQNVIFTGRVSDAELAALYNCCDIFVLPSRTVLTGREPKGEGFGIVYMEAMAFGKPVIGPDTGAPAEVIPHGRCGLLVDPEDSAAVAEALIELLTNPTKCREMGQAGREWVRAQFGYGRFRERLRAILDDMPRPD